VVRAFVAAGGVMQRAFGARWTWCALAVGLFGAVAPAQAIEFWDERIQIHGFLETRMSFGYEDFNQKNEIDMYGWLQVLNVEAEAEIAPDGWGPFDMVAAFARVEVKYDCVWSHACGLFDSVDAFGNNPKNLPNRVQTGERLGIAGSQIINDTRPYWFADRQRLNGGIWEDAKAGQRAAKSFVYGSTNVGLFGASPGPDVILGDFQDIRNETPHPLLPNGYSHTTTDPTTMLPGDDDAGVYLFSRTSRCDVGNTTNKASNIRGFSNRELIWGIDSCHIDPIGFNREIANPFADAVDDPLQALEAGDVNPVLLAINLDPTSAGFGAPLDADGVPDGTALPFRPGPEFNALPKNRLNRAGGQKIWHSQGIFVPNQVVRKKLRSESFGTYDQNFSLNELQWNRGASQEPLKELREIYLEFEAFESRLWVRGGKQTIVWGKTELFRNQDQWNPVDIAIGPLASLEESRIALWALRGIWSFYEVGPLEDVRLELVGLFDKFEPTDVGRCGEPFVPRLACAKSYGLWVHGQNATGVAGEIRPDDPWNDTEGIEVGARVEFRWDRFSFAITDYWGFTDTPYQSLLFQYSRNVDPVTGRPRHTQATGPCTTGTTAEPACLVPGMNPNGSPTPDIDDGVIANHSINQSLFSWICAGTVGVAPAVDASACAFTLFNSQLAPLGVPFSAVFASIVGGTTAGATRFNILLGETALTGGSPVVQPILLAAFGPGGTNTLFPYPVSPLLTASPLVPLNYDGVTDNPVFNAGVANSFATYTTNEQEALWGCGTFYSTSCDAQGFDLANMEASVTLQSFTWFEGTYFNTSWDTTRTDLPQPGTVDAVLQGDGTFAGNVDVTNNNDRKKHGLKPGDVATGSVAVRYEDDGNGIDDDGDGKKKDLFILPGARYDPAAFAAAIAALPLGGAELDPYLQRHFALYDATVDGTVGTRVHPFTGQVWASEMAIASWNFMMLAASLGAQDGAISRTTLDRNQPLAIGRCSFRQPQYCAFVSGLNAQARNTHSSIKAGGNGKFGRRNLVWQSVGDLALSYQKRNILGFSMDFAEDTTKSSWGVEFTHVNDALAADNGEIDGLQDVDEYNLTLSVDRPTFINFLNANRTFFINSQLFTSYLQGYEKTMLRDGPWTFLALLNVSTGYFQDRFLVSSAVVYDLRSNSGAFLPSVQYRFTENFSVTLGAAVLAGHWERREMGVNQFSAQSENNLDDTIFVENGISPARDLDNFFLRLRYTY
jgi:hypothetical protein